MSTRRWAFAVIAAGLVSLAIVGYMVSLTNGAGLPDGSVIHFELAGTPERVNGVLNSGRERGASIAAMDGVNTLDVWAFIPAYTLFGVFAALFLSGGDWRRPLTFMAILAIVGAAGADYLETTTLLALTKDGADMPALIPSLQIGAWTKFALLAAHALFCAGLCFLGTPRRVVLGVLLLLPVPGVAAAAIDPVQYSNVMNISLAVGWMLALFVAAIIFAVRAKGAQA